MDEAAKQGPRQARPEGLRGAPHDGRHGGIDPLSDPDGAVAAAAELCARERQPVTCNQPPI